MDLYARFKAELFPGPCSDQEARRLFHEIETRYSEPGRLYHNLRHIENCINVFDSVAHGATEPKAIFAALMTHDVLRDEDQSAEFAYVRLQDAGLCERFCECVMRCVLATAHGGDLKDLNQQIIADIDLSELAVDWETFSFSSRNLRSEDAHLTDDEYREKKLKFFNGLLERRTIYYGAPFQILFEARARENIRRAIAELSAK